VGGPEIRQGKFGDPVTAKVNVQGRPHTLSVNYRISEEEARTYADRLSRSLAEVDAKREEGVLSSLLRGPAPMVSIFRDSIAET
jgi:hypothetical protein